MKRFSGELIDPILDLSYLLIRDSIKRVTLWQEPAYQWVLLFVQPAFVGGVRMSIVYGYRGEQLWQWSKFTAIVTCDGAKDLAESFSVQLSERFKALLNCLCASTGYLYNVSKSCGSLIQCQQNGLWLLSTDHGINLPMPKLLPLIETTWGRASILRPYSRLCCGCPLRCCLRLTFSVRSIFRAFNNPRSI